jgi:hypothetical protein
MSRQSYVGYLGLSLAVVVPFLEHLHVRDPWMVWGLFIVGFTLVSDWVIHLDSSATRKIVAVAGMLAGFLAIGLLTHHLWKRTQTTASSPVTAQIAAAPPIPALPSGAAQAQKDKPAAPKRNHKRESRQTAVVNGGSDNNSTSSGNIKQGPGSIAQVGGTNNSATIYNGPPPLAFEIKTQIVPSDKEGLVKTIILVTPNQTVPPPVEMFLDFDRPVE